MKQSPPRSTIKVNELTEYHYDLLFNYASIKIDRENDTACLKAEMKIDGQLYLACFDLGPLDTENPSGLIDDSIRLYENVEGIDWGSVALTIAA